MNLNVQVKGNDVLAVCKGAIYVEEAARLREQLIAYTEQGSYQISINFEGVDYIDSSGLGVLVAIHKRALQNGGAMKIKGLKGNVKELFELTRLTKVFVIE